MLTKKAKARVEAATFKLPRLGGQGVLIPGGYLLTAAHCIGWTSTGAMVLGDYFIEPATIGRKKFSLAPLAVEACSDVAVLGPLDNQEFSKEVDAWESHCEAAEPVELWTGGCQPFETFPVYVLTHRRAWVECEAQATSPDAHCVWVQASKQIQGGTSGGPIVTKDGALVGVVSHSSETGGKCDGLVYRPHLNLPPWILRTAIQ